MDSLTHSMYYHVKLRSPWNLEFDIHVIGTVSKLTIAEVQDYDLRASYFTKYGLGLATYLNTVKDETPIYFGFSITNKSPIALDTKKVFIPQSLIDFNSTYNYLIGSKPTFAVKISDRYFGSTLEENKFAKNAQASIVKVLNANENFVADTISSQYSSIDSLLTQNDVDEFETLKDNKLIENNQFILQEKLVTEAKSRELYDKRVEMETAKAEYLDAKKRYEGLIASLYTAQQEITSENLILSGVREVMVTTIEKIKNLELNPANFTNFSEIYESVKASIESS